MIIDKQAAVRMFMEKMGWPQDMAKKPLDEALWDQVGLIRAAHLNKQVFELTEGWARKDLVEIADGIADLLYLAFGTAADAGIDIEPIFEAVHASNMTKEPRTGLGGDGRFRPRGAGYVSPKEAIREALKKQGFFQQEAVSEAS